MATLVVFSGVDGYVYKGPNATYAQSRGDVAGGNITVDATSSFLEIGQVLFGGNYFCYEGFFDFDTSALGSGAAISSAILSLYGSSDSSVTEFTLEARPKDFGASLDTGDFVIGSDLGSLTLLGQFSTASGFSTSGYNDFSDNAMSANVNKTGSTRILVNSSRHRGNNTPVGEERIAVYTVEQAGTTNDPKLTVTYTQPVTFFGSATTSVLATTSGTLTIPASVPVDATLVVAFTSRDHTAGTAQPTVTDNDTGGNTWTQLYNSTDRKAQLWGKKATSGTSSKTITISGCVGSMAGVLKVFTNASTDVITSSVINITPETNASGDESHAAFTPTISDSMLCAVIFNYANDNSVTSLAFANAGALTTTQVLSTGGNDSATAFGHVLQSGAPADTGTLTWAQTNGTTYSLTFIISPPTTPVSQTQQALIESLIGISDSSPTAIESLVRIAASKQEQIEALTTIRDTNIASIESLLGLADATQAYIENLGKIASTRQAIIEALLKIADTSSANIEAYISGITTTKQANIESLFGLTAAKQAQIEALLGVVDFTEFKIEYLIKISDINQVYVESIQNGITQTHTANTESLLKVAQTRQALYESLFGVAQTATSRNESLQAIAGTRQAKLEALASLATTKQAQIESLLTIAATKVANLESLLTLNTLKAVNIESLVQISNLTTTVIEALLGLRTTFQPHIESSSPTGVVLQSVIRIESLVGVAATNPANLESQLALSSAFNALLEILLGIRNLAETDIESLSEIEANRTANIENFLFTLAEVLYESNLESLQGIAAQIETKLEAIGTTYTPDIIVNDTEGTLIISFEESSILIVRDNDGIRIINE